MKYKALKKTTIKLQTKLIFHNNFWFIITYHNAKVLKKNKFFLNSLFYNRFSSLKLNNISKRQLETLGFPSSLTQGNITIFYCSFHSVDDVKRMGLFLEAYCFPFIYIQEKRFLYLDKNDITCSHISALVNLVDNSNISLLQATDYHLRSVPSPFYHFFLNFFFIFIVLNVKKAHE